MGDFGLGDVGVDAGHGIGERGLLEDLFPELGERGTCVKHSLSAVCPECPQCS